MKRKISPELLKIAQPIIHKIAKSRKQKHKFAYFDSEDIYQEIYVLCLDALSRYKPECGLLEHYLNSHVTNRLKNLKRDKYFRVVLDDPSLTQKRINIVNAVGLDNVKVLPQTKFLASSSPEPDPFLSLEAKDLEEIIIDSLPPYLVEHFKNLLMGKKIKKNILEEIRSYVSLILRDINNA